MPADDQSSVPSAHKGLHHSPHRPILPSLRHQRPLPPPTQTDQVTPSTSVHFDQVKQANDSCGNSPVENSGPVCTSTPVLETTASSVSGHVGSDCPRSPGFTFSGASSSRAETAHLINCCDVNVPVEAVLYNSQSITPQAVSPSSPLSNQCLGSNFGIHTTATSVGCSSLTSSLATSTSSPSLPVPLGYFPSLASKAVRKQECSSQCRSFSGVAVSDLSKDSNGPNLRSGRVGLHGSRDTRLPAPPKSVQLHKQHPSFRVVSSSDTPSETTLVEFTRSEDFSQVANDHSINATVFISPRSSVGRNSNSNNIFNISHLEQVSSSSSNMSSDTNTTTTTTSAGVGTSSSFLGDLLNSAGAFFSSQRNCTNNNNINISNIVINSLSQSNTSPLQQNTTTTSTNTTASTTVSLTLPRPEHQRTTNVYVDTPFPHRPIPRRITTTSSSSDPANALFSPPLHRSGSSSTALHSFSSNNATSSGGQTNVSGSSTLPSGHRSGVAKRTFVNPNSVLHHHSSSIHLCDVSANVERFLANSGNVSNNRLDDCKSRSAGAKLSSSSFSFTTSTSRGRSVSRSASQVGSGRSSLLGRSFRSNREQSADSRNVGTVENAVRREASVICSQPSSLSLSKPERSSHDIILKNLDNSRRRHDINTSLKKKDGKRIEDGLRDDLEDVSKDLTIRNEDTIPCGLSFSRDGAGVTRRAPSAAIVEESIICSRCHRCKCEACRTPKSPPSAWICSGRCLCSAASVVDFLSCACCVKAALYHCGTTDETGPAGALRCTRGALRSSTSSHPSSTASDEDGSERGLPATCGCFERRYAVWACLALSALPLPCLLCYFPLTGIRRCFEHGYRRCTNQGCRCKPPPLDASSNAEAMERGGLFWSDSMPGVSPGSSPASSRVSSIPTPPPRPPNLQSPSIPVTEALHGDVIAHEPK